MKLRHVVGDWLVAVAGALLAAGLFAGPAHAANVTRIADLPKGQDIMMKAAKAMAKREINVALLGGEKYMVNNCLGIKASAGKFKLRLDNPQVSFEGQSVIMKFMIDRVHLQALKIRMKPNASNPLETCKFSKAFKVSGSATKVKFVMRLGAPVADLDQCRMPTLGPVEARWHVGGLNLKPLQNNLDEVAKEMIEAALNASVQVLMTTSALPILDESMDLVCETKVVLYRRYMDVLGAGVTLYRLPDDYVDQLKGYYPNVNLRSVRFGFSDRQPPGNATTDCHNMYFSSRDYTEKLRTGTVDDDFFWLYHELRHTEQCKEVGGRDPYAEMWFKHLEYSALTTNINNPDYYKVLHDRMPMERDADARATAVENKLGGLSPIQSPASSAPSSPRRVPIESRQEAPGR
ncbi:MAG: hypothetical protein ACOYXU_14835 [Nitrospirota bacterium]